LFLFLIESGYGQEQLGFELIRAIEQIHFMRLLSNRSSLLGLRDVAIQAAYWIATAPRASL
jgi:hypothetical protein